MKNEFNKNDEKLIPVNPDDYKIWINKYDHNFPYINPSPYKIENGNKIEQFPIIASSLLLDKENNVIVEDIIKAYEAGFTIWSQNSTGMTAIYENLKLSQKENVNLITNNHTFYRGLYSVDYLNKYLDALGGIWLADEPKYKFITGVIPNPNASTYEEQVNYLQSGYKNLMQQEPPIDRIITINLIGSPEKDWMSNPDSPTKPTFEDYKEYVRAFQDNFKPSYFSYDRYPIRENANLLYEGIRDNLKYDGNEGDITVDDEFYDYLKFFHNFTSNKDIDRPFWVFCQSQSFMSLEFILYRPKALEQYLLFEAFGALAYGAKGIAYWSYAVATTNNRECFLSALTDRRNRPTAAWHFAKRVNAQIHKYSDIFLNAKLTQVKHPVPMSGKLEIQSDRPDAFMASTFTDDDAVYLMLTSRDPLNYQNLTIKTVYSNITELTPEKSGGEENVLLPAFKAIKRILIPGGFRIFKSPKS